MIKSSLTVSPQQESRYLAFVIENLKTSKNDRQKWDCYYKGVALMIEDKALFARGTI